MDADGDLDVIACKLSSGAEVLFNDGAGTFTAGGSFASGQIVDVAVADFNGDRRPDIVLANASSSSVVYMNNGAGVFTASSTALGAYTQIYAVCAGNIDGDSDTDVVAVASNVAYVFKLSGGAFTETGSLTLGNGDYEPRLADLDGDADLDLVIAVQQGQSRAFINDGTPILFWQTASNFGGGASPSS